MLIAAVHDRRSWHVTSERCICNLAEIRAKADIARHNFLFRFDGRHGAESAMSAFSDAIGGKPEAHFAHRWGLDFCREQSVSVRERHQGHLS
jgi:hypothetical protein